MQRILVTGAAGFIGFHVARHLLQRGANVVGIDNVSPYYDVALKRARLGLLRQHSHFSFVEADLADRKVVSDLFADLPFDRVAHLAAQAGVRYSIDNPHAYVESNLVGFLNVLEGCRHQRVPHLMYASSSSVYGANTRLPFSVRDNVDHPVSLYAATKKSNELMAHAYAHLYNIPVTGLRFFTVYGPWGRPDMAYFKFTDAILAGKPIDVFNHGEMERDFTYIDDVAESLVRIMNRIPEGNPSWDGAHPDPSSSRAPFRLYNIGNHTPENLLYMIDILERLIGKPAIRRNMPMQPGDVQRTAAEVSDLERDVGFAPSTSLELGLRRFVEWYRAYYRR